MNFDNAIIAHTAWKNKLKGYLQKKDGSLNPDDIQSDKKCDLGQWICGEGRQLESDPSFLELRKKHAEFHIAAATLVRKMNAGESVGEELEVGSRSEFSKATAAVVNVLAKLKKEIK